MGEGRGKVRFEEINWLKVWSMKAKMTMKQTNKDSAAPLLCFVDMHLSLH
jgi:hypothetical protein